MVSDAEFGAINTVMSGSRSLRGTSSSSLNRQRSRRLSIPLAGNSSNVGDSKLPSYAQPTISFAQHASNKQALKALTLKAGVSKSRPSSVATIRATYKSRPSSNKKAPGFFNLFDDVNGDNGDIQIANSTPKKNRTLSGGSTDINKENMGDKDDGSHRRLSASSSYRSPSLAHKVTGDGLIGKPSGLDMKSIMQETEALIEKIGASPIERNIYSKEDFYAFVKEKNHVSKEDWLSLVDYHCHVCDQLQDKIKLNHNLIQNILELNNHISTSVKVHESKLEAASTEISALQSLLGISDAFPKSCEPQESPISSAKNSKASSTFEKGTQVSNTLVLLRNLDCGLPTIDTPITLSPDDLDQGVSSQDDDVEDGTASKAVSPVTHIDNDEDDIGDGFVSPLLKGAEYEKYHTFKLHSPSYHFQKPKSPFSPFVVFSKDENGGTRNNIYEDVYSHSPSLEQD